MKKIILKLEQLCGLTWSENITKLNSKCEENENRAQWIYNKVLELRETVIQLEDEVEKLKNPVKQAILEVMHESDETCAKQLVNTPFVIAREKEDYYVVCGTYRLNDEPFKTEAEAVADAQREDWQRQLVMIQMLIENNNAMQAKPKRVTTKKQ